MPCYDNRNDLLKQNTHAKNHELKKQIERTQIERTKMLEAMLCAVITELEKENVSHTVLTNAQKNGAVGLMDFWARHKIQDEQRIRNDLELYSKHEIEMIRKIIEELPK